MIESTEHKHFPWFTTLFSVLLVGIYAVMALYSKSFTINQGLLEKFGAPYATQIYNGHVYGVITNNLIHLNILHLSANLLGLWLFGAFLERRIGWFKMAMLGLVCSIFGSMLQLTLTDDAGLGISSAIFGFYTLILILSFKDRRFRMRYIYTLGVLILAALLLMIIYNQLFGEEAAIEAKIGGIFWGILMGLGQREGDVRWQLLTLYLLPFSLAAVTLFYSPWSSQWQLTKGIIYHQKHDLDRAESYYKTAIQLDGSNKLAKDNYNLIRIERLSYLAYNAHQTGEFTTARRYYLKILSIEKRNRWAADNLKELP